MPEFFDKIVMGINKSAAAVTENSRAVLEKSKINSAIKSLETERSRQYNLLGRRIYELRMAGINLPADDGVARCAGEIDRCCESIAGYQEEIRRIDEEVRLNIEAAETARLYSQDPGLYESVCRCGFTNEPDALFCAACGQRTGQPCPQPASYCPNCGKANNDSAAFCYACGGKL